MTTSRSQDDGATDPYRGVSLAASAHSVKVFTSLAEQCVSELCDGCLIEFVDGGASHRLHVASLSDLDQSRVERRVVFVSTPNGLEGAATFLWSGREPSASDIRLLHVLVEHAVTVVAEQRSVKLAADAARKIKNLETALATSRRIGIAIGVLMGVHKIGEKEAFALLSVASQRMNRKLRDIALDVIETGALETPTTGTATSRRPSSVRPPYRRSRG